MAAPLSYKNDSEEDSRLNPTELAQQEQSAGEGSSDYINAGTDQAEAYANDPSNAAQNDLQNREVGQNEFSYSPGGQTSSPSSVKGFFKKVGPTGGIIGLIAGAIFGGSVFFSPGLLLVQVKEVLTNHGSSASRAAPMRFQENLYYRLSGGKELEQACSKPVSIKCKRGTMKDENVKKLKAAGFDINSTKVGDRHIVTSIAKDGVTIDNSRSSLDRAFANPKFASDFNRVINPKSLVFLGDRFSAKVLKKLGLNKSKVTLEGKDEDERRAALNKTTGGDLTLEEEAEKLRSDIDEKTEKSGAKSSSGKVLGSGAKQIGAAAVLCTTYNTARVVVASVKLQNMLKYAAFAMVFLKAADQIKAKGDISPETASTLGTVLTKTDASGSKKGLSATDSQGYKVAMYGGEKGLQNWTRNYMLGGSAGLKGIEKSIDWINRSVPGEKSTVRAVCKGATNPVIGAGVTAAICAANPGTLSVAAAGSIVPGVGNIVGGLAATGICSVATITLGFVAGYIVGKLIDKLIVPGLVEKLQDSTIDVNKISGVDAGNALAMGGGVILEQTNMSRGLQPGTKESVPKYLAATAESETQQIEIAKYEARDNPFDIYDQYSFLGSFIRQTGMIQALSNNPSLGSLAFGAGSLVQLSSNIIPKAGAVGSMPVNVTEEDLSNCPDLTLSEIGIDCDAVGGTQFVMRTDIPVEENLDYMIGTHVDDEGKPISEEYKNWVENCTEQREDPLGVTTTPIEQEDDYDTGKACVPTKETQEMLDQFSTYYFDDAARQDEDGEVEEEASTGPANSTGPGVVMTYNVRGADKDGLAWSARKQHVINVIKEKSPDIIGLQEMNEGVQHKDLKAALPDYGIWDGNEGGEGQKRPIMWKSSVYEKIDGGIYKHQRYSDSEKQPAPWVKLRNKINNSELYVFNYHGIAHDSNADKKIKGAKDLVKAINEIAGSSAPVVITGDFNSDYGKFAHPIILAAGFVDAFQVAETKINGDYQTHHGDPGTTRRKGTKHIDHIFVRPSFPVSNWENVINNDTTRASDHTPVVATIGNPNNVDSGGTPEGPGNQPSRDGWIWPIQSGLIAGPCYGGSRVHAGMDINVKGFSTPLYAAHDGVVESTPRGGAGGNQIRVKVSENLYYWYQHMKSPSSLKPGDKVYAGRTVLGIVGTTGNVKVRAGYAHFHLTVFTKKNDFPSYGNLGSSFDPIKVLPTPAPGGYKCYSS